MIAARPDAGGITVADGRAELFRLVDVTVSAAFTGKTPDASSCGEFLAALKCARQLGEFTVYHFDDRCRTSLR